MAKMAVAKEEEGARRQVQHGNDHSGVINQSRDNTLPREL